MTKKQLEEKYEQLRADYGRKVSELDASNAKLNASNANFDREYGARRKTEERVWELEMTVYHLTQALKYGCGPKGGYSIPGA